MVAFNFSQEFVGSIETGIKTQTLRAKKRAKPGDILQLYTGMRTKACRLIVPPVVCLVADYCHIAPDEITFGNKDLHPKSIDEFAAMDGFTSYEALLRWFENKYGQNHFIGFVHRWRNQP